MRFYTADQIDNAIASVKTDGEKLQNKIHRVAASCVKMCHDDQYRARNKPEDLIQIAGVFANRMNALLDNAPWHSQSLGEWIAQKTPLMFSEENERFYAPKDPRGVENGRLFANKDQLRDAIDNPFWTVAPPKAGYKPLTIFKQIDALRNYLSAQDKHIKKPHKDDNFSKDANELIREAIAILEQQAPAE